MADSVGLGPDAFDDALSGGGSAPGFCAVMSCRSSLGVKHSFQRFEAIGLARRLVPAQPIDPGKAHRQSGLVAGDRPLFPPPASQQKPPPPLVVHILLPPLQERMPNSPQVPDFLQRHSARKDTPPSSLPRPRY